MAKLRGRAYRYEAIICVYNYVMMSLCLQDGSHTCHGDVFSESVSSLLGRLREGEDIIAGVGVNCTGPQFIEVLC